MSPGLLSQRSAMNLSAALVLLAGTFWTSPGAAETAIQLRAAPSTVRVRPEGPFEGADSVAIAAARNEVESFQVVISAVGGNLTGVDASVSPLRSENGAEILAENIELFRVAFVPVRHPAPRAVESPGLVPDPLVPFKNPYTGEPLRAPWWSGRELVGGRFGGTGFDLWEGQQQPVWADVTVPRETAAGVYTGSFRVAAKGAESVEIPVRLEVWDFTLPDGPSHENHFGGFHYAARYLGIDAASDEFATIEDRYIAMMAAHRINPPIPSRLLPSVTGDGTVEVNDETDGKLSEFVERHHLTNIQVPRAPFGDMLGANREKAKNFYRSWYAYLEQKGWTKGAYLYMLDEPNSAEAYEEVRQLGALVREAEPRLRRLVVEQPYVQHPDWGTLDDAIDIWCPLFGFVHEESVKRVQARGDEVWSYSALVQSAPGYHPEYETVKNDNPPYWQIDFPVTSYRVAPWLNRRYGITGLLYWSTVYWFSPDRNPWDDPGFRVRWNGDGALFYPGREAGIDGPIASIRLKNLRDGLEDYEYFVILESLGGSDAVDQAVRTAVPTWGSWNPDSDALPNLREQLAQAILERKQ